MYFNIYNNTKAYSYFPLYCTKKKKSLGCNMRKGEQETLNKIHRGLQTEIQNSFCN